MDLAENISGREGFFNVQQKRDAEVIAIDRSSKKNGKVVTPVGSDDWRNFMNRKELAAYDAGESLPRESSRISRNKREVSLGKAIESKTGNNEKRLQVRQVLDSITSLATVAASCAGCGKWLCGDISEARATVRQC